MMGWGFLWMAQTRVVAAREIKYRKLMDQSLDGLMGLVGEVRDGILMRPKLASCSWIIGHLCQEVTNSHSNEAPTLCCG